MNRTTYFNSPFLLGFEHLERLLERTAKSAGDGYPPYNIEEFDPETLKITLAVAGFSREELSVTVEDNQLVIRGKQSKAPIKRFYIEASRLANSNGRSCLPKVSK
jgi:HSP20 family molecular chaperone IbpA